MLTAQTTTTTTTATSNALNIFPRTISAIRPLSLSVVCLFHSFHSLLLYYNVLSQIAFSPQMIWKTLRKLSLYLCFIDFYYHVIVHNLYWEGPEKWMEVNDFHFHNAHARTNSNLHKICCRSNRKLHFKYWLNIASSCQRIHFETVKILSKCGGGSDGGINNNNSSHHWIQLKLYTFNLCMNSPGRSEHM